jgi:tetratricopeptide (TPR) repeat protein
VDAEVVTQRGLPPQATYTFKHALIQDAAYESLLRSNRQQYHQRIAQVLTERFPETVETQPEVVAQHYTAAGLHAEALPYWQRAGQRALERSAYREAVASLEKGLEALSHLPQNRATLEQAIDLRLDLRSALWPSGNLGRIVAYVREAETLAEALDDPRRLHLICRRLTGEFFAMGAYDQAIAAGQRARATAGGEGVLQVLSYINIGSTYWAQGDYRRAIDCFEPIVVCFDGARRHERTSGAVFLPGV